MIDQEDSSVKWAMIITKRGQKIVAFECFHGLCWEKYFDENVALEVERVLRKERKDLN